MAAKSGPRVAPRPSGGKVRPGPNIKQSSSGGPSGHPACSGARPVAGWRPKLPLPPPPTAPPPPLHSAPLPGPPSTPPPPGVGAWGTGPP
eukprot:10383770-Alexandrium_andersonii.AAC.1